MLFPLIMRVVIPLVLVVILITQVLIPMFSNRSYFWAFRKTKDSKERLSDVVTNIDAAKGELSSIDKDAKKLKNEADSLAKAVDKTAKTVSPRRKRSKRSISDV